MREKKVKKKKNGRERLRGRKGEKLRSRDEERYGVKRKQELAQRYNDELKQDDKEKICYRARDKHIKEGKRYTTEVNIYHKVLNDTDKELTHVTVL